MVRLKDIAVRAGVSVMTVSKVLRDAPDISAATKARVRLLSQQMGYMPDTVAQGLRNRTTKLFGLVISSTTNPVFARTVMAIEEQAYELGYDVVLSHSLNMPEREERVVRRLLSRRVDGIFLTPVYRLDPSVPLYDELLRRGTPTVLLGHRAPFCNKFVNVETDDLGGSYAAARHLLDLGHKRIAFFAGPPAAPAAQERLEGYRKALREAEIEIDDKLIFNAGSTSEEGEKAALQFLQEAPPATAIQASSDMVAIGAANIFLNQGLRIPDDLSIAGFGNVLVSEHFRVPLTTIRQPKLRLGTAAMESMVRLLRGEKPETRRLSAEIVIRKSTAPPSPKR
ncbi:MAG TPA: LacI family DNA-binding transcriptional regulator [Candidatus Saccharimonadales bacterium]|nr:LacI family DNA-binding transcriptional regulator [Candidatus Saccharimonadales bacterium]